MDIKIGHNSNSERDYNNSSIFDVHTWSDYKEVNSFVDVIYSKYFKHSVGNIRIEKKHLKVVLLDLYVAWLTDEKLNIAINMTRDFYSNNFGAVTSRYNELHISAKTIDVINVLRSVGMSDDEKDYAKEIGFYDQGLIGFKKGIEAQEGFDSGFVSRIWATPKLIKMFEESAFSQFMIHSHRDREVLVMKDEDKNLIDYVADDKNKEMAFVVRQYNELLERTFIDIGEANSPTLTIKKSSGSKNPDKPHYVHITHNGKFTHRVFNDSSWQKSGRWFGGFWQRINSDLREKILINDEDTVELDFSSLHVILAYANEGIDYWKDHDVDPYSIPVEGIENHKASREAIKKLLLLGLNAPNDEVLFPAFRQEFDYSHLGGKAFKFENSVLSKMLDSIKARHPQIAHQLGKDVGKTLMNLDGQIVDFVIKRFLDSNTPILSVHDSFIVPWSQRDKLASAMQDAFASVTDNKDIVYKQSLPIYQDAVAWRHRDRDFYLDKMSELKTTKRSRGYLNRLNKHNMFFNPKPNTVQYIPEEIVDPKNYRKYKDRHNR